jgi:hypothetical protein
LKDLADGRYLEQNATPHWRHAYIDYAACDRQICVIAARIGGTAVKDTDEDEDHGPTARVKIKAGRPRPSESGLRRQFVAPPHVSLPSLLFSVGET